MTPLPAEPNPLVGTWKLVSFQFEAEGTNMTSIPSDLSFSQLIGAYWRW
jgi:hypothetical protein